MGAVDGREVSSAAGAFVFSVFVTVTKLAMLCVPGGGAFGRFVLGIYPSRVDHAVMLALDGQRGEGSYRTNKPPEYLLI